ncbi:MAG: hypothetical protein V1876_01540, partial [Candidatus Peregrinibacteria bacterium]
RIDLVANAPDQSLSLTGFMDKFRDLTDSDKGGSFDDFCKAVALRVRKDRPTGPITVKQSELEAAADHVAAELLKKPATTTPAAAPANAPVAAPETKPPEGQTVPPTPVYTFETIPAGTNLLGTQQKLTLANHTFDLFVSGDGTIKVDNVTYKLQVSKFIGVLGVGTTQWLSPKIDRLVWEENALSCTGNWYGISEKKVITRDVLEKFLQSHLNGTRNFENEKISLKQVS